MRRFIAVICVLAVALSIAVYPAGAEEIKLRTKTAVSIRVKPSSTARSLGTVKAGTILTQVSLSGSWVKVKYRNDVGYVPKSSVSKVQAVKTGVIQVGGAKMYLNASASSKLLYTLRKGTSVQVYSSTSSWTKVKYYGKTGYIQTKFFSPKAEAKPGPSASATVAPTAAPMVSYKVEYVVLDGLALYSSASAKSASLGKLPYGAEVHVYGAQGNYKKIVYGSKKGYVLGKYLSAAAPRQLTDSEAVVVYVELRSDDENAAVTALQERLIELGYMTGPSDGKYGAKTVAAVKKYQSTAKLDATGVATAETQSSIFSTGAPQAPVAQTVVTAAATVKNVKAVDWFTGGIQQVFPVGKVVTVTDVVTRISWQEKRTGGWWHADCQPLTAADTVKMLRACGSWSWARRAIWVTIDGSAYAASMNCMPHNEGGSDSMPYNDFDGCHCIHFTNSKVHGRNCVDSDHQAAIAKALAAAK